MAMFMVERYLPVSHEAELLRIVAGARAAAATMTTGDHPIHHLESLLVIADDTCFCLFEAPSGEAVSQLNAAAGLTFERIVEVDLVVRASDFGGLDDHQD